MFYHIEREERHRAYMDALAAHRLYEILKKKFYEGEKELFLPRELQYHGKKQTKATLSQKNYLKELSEYHKITIDIPIEELTRSEASRLADKIIRQHGKIPDALRHRNGNFHP